MEEYDYVVVGGGTAGSVLANRLTADPGTSVLVLEAGGGPPPPEVDDPTAWVRLLGSPIDWGYRSTAQPGLDGRRTREPRGRGLGGSSNLYLMMHVRGHPADFDAWAYQGAAGWSYRDVLPYFTKMEAQEDATGPGTGTSGPQRITNAGRHDPNPTSRAFIDACVELGHREVADFNAGDMWGAGWHHLDIADGRRQGAYASYLEPALGRPGLTVRTGALATRLLLDGAVCTGVEYAADGELRRVRAAREVILCGGAIESPKLLMLSGIGDAADARELGIEPKVHLPGVGRNFHNHVLTGVMAELTEPVPPPRQNLSESALFTGSRPGLPAPDLQIAFVHAPFDIIVGRDHPNTVSVLPGVVRPASRGRVRLAGADPLAHPLVDPNYLADRSDLDRLVQGVGLAREIFATGAFQKWGAREISPGPGVAEPAELAAFVRATADSYHHQAGSCRMGTDDLAVVDPGLAVRGVERLRVADASVMPSVPSGNCHAAVVMIAERLADILAREGHE
ncbi:GMC family oxidoreductase [Actinomadura fibrosa]|uniref:GMC family oxidoreductase n=1 Tax=Actinomadura fibrosa TaxID=111802 RepID=A0ABW2XQB6_9ACTN|nr:GMC family oxidoreductase N-terminal domain-containing protein [Actinomadura fibrosa]